MVLLDNIIFDLQEYGGVSNVWNALLLKVKEEKFPVKIIPSRKVISLIDQENFLKVNETRYPIFLKRYLDVKIKGVDLFHSSYFRVHKSSKVKNIVTIHDFTYEKFDKGIRKWIHLRQKRHALKNASSIICVSQNTKKDLMEFHPWINEDIVSVIYNGYDKKTFYPINKNEKKNRFLLTVGGRNKHKNFKFTLELMSLKFIKKNNIKLIVVGGGSFNNNEMKIIKKNNLTDTVTQIDKVSDFELNQLYNSALALVYPSLYEGFGIPPLEALASGCPVICSSLSSLPEVVGDCGLFIDTEKPESAIPHIEFLFDKQNQRKIIDKGLKQASKFSWDKTAQQTIELYRKILKE